MTSPQLKDRLLSLKHITENLRQSTHSPNLNMNHLRTLIHNLKQISNNPASPQARNLPGLSRLFPSQQNSYDYDKYAFSSNETSMKAGDMRRMQQQNATQKEIIALREENLKLQKTLTQLRTELQNKSKQEAEMKSDKNQSQLPYFKHSQVIKTFVCRFQISEGQYNKIEYFNRKVDLHLDKLQVLHKEKGIVEEFDLTSLQDVAYLPGNVILYRLREFMEEQTLPLSMQRDATQLNGGLTNIFFKFQSEEQLKKWDLSIYSNYQLSSNLTTLHPFKDYFSQLRTHKQIQRDIELRSSIEESKELSLLQQKELLQFYLKKKDEYVLVKNIVQEKIPISREVSMNTSQVQKEQSEGNVDKKRVKGSGQNVIFDIANNYINDGPPQEQIQEPQKNPNKKKIPQYLQNPDQPPKPEQNFEKQNILVHEEANRQKEHRFSFSMQKEHQQWGQQHLWQSQQPLGINHSNNNGNMLSTQPLQLALYQTASSEQIGPLKVVHNRVSQARKNLQAGYEATKYSKDGIFSHEKKVFLSLDCKKLCWCEKDRQSEYKSIPLKMIVKVTYGIVGEGIVKHVSKFDSRNYCVIEYLTGDYKKKTIELGATPHSMRSLSEELDIIIEYNKKQEIKTIVES